MKYVIYLFIIVTITLQNTCRGHQDTGYNDLFEWYYKQSLNAKQDGQNVQFREKRQNQRRFGLGSNFNNNYDDDDDWYIFDEVQDNSQNRPQVNRLPVGQNGRQFGQQFGQQLGPTTTTQKPIIPNGEPVRLSRCEENCNARTTPQYNPVCGSNGVTYYNGARLDCAIFCGQNIQLNRIGRCAPLLPPV